MDKYNKALEKAKLGLPIDEIFPELKESEDEKIRKAISAAICGTTAESVLEANGVKLIDALAYLEKQKEQKPVEWSEEDKKNFEWFDKFFRAESVIAGGKDIPQDKYLWFKSLCSRPKSSDNWKPSEEQMRALKEIIEYCRPIHNGSTSGWDAFNGLCLLYNDLQKLL